MSLLRSTVLLVLLLAAAACASSGGRGAAEYRERTTVRVENQSFLDMNVYVFRGSQRVRLGMVPGVSTRSLTIPANLIFGVSALRFQADPVGRSQTSVTQEISVSEGDEVVLTIPNR